jgi:hypothetical protein
MRDSLPTTLSPVGENAGFTLVEDDDVAFNLALCREIRRIYDDYQDGALTADDSLRSGLSLTIEMFAMLRGTVTDGMPALRLEVGAAQAKEMLMTMFDPDVPWLRSSPSLDGPLGVAAPPLISPPEPRSRRWTASWDKQPLIVKILATLLALALVPVFIDAPFAILALFPNYLYPLSAAFVALALAAKPVSRAIRTRWWSSA